MAFDQCSPGSHSHSHRPNWQPAETVEQYLRNCQEGLETYSEQRLANVVLEYLSKQNLFHGFSHDT